MDLFIGLLVFCVISKISFAPKEQNQVICFISTEVVCLISFLLIPLLLHSPTRFSGGRIGLMVISNHRFVVFYKP